MTTPLEDTRFLSQSDNRLQALKALSEGPLHSQELREAIGASRSTLGRTIGSFEERSWIRKTDDGYELTAVGMLIAEEFTAMLDSMAAATKLRSVVDIVDIEQFGLALSDLADAEVILPEKHNPIAPIHRATEELHRTNEGRILLQFLTPELLDPLWKLGVESEDSVEIIFRSGAIEGILADERMSQRFDDLVSAKHSSVMVHDGELPLNMGIFSDNVSIGLLDDQALPRALIVSTNDVVREWAESLFDSYRRRSERVPMDARTSI